MIKSIFKTFVLSLLLIAQVHLAYSQTAALLPNATQVYLDNNGKPLSSGTVGYYIPGTTTGKLVWQDANQVTPWTNPITLNAAGRPPTDKGIYGNGVYRQIVKDRNNNIIWDQPTSATASASAGTNVGDGNLVGTILPWAGMIAPAQYQFAYGQAISRTTYADLLTAITLSTSISCTGGNATITGIADTSNIPVGSPLEAICVVAGSTVLSKTLTTVTLSINASITATVVGKFFPWGNGNGTTTFNAPDLRGIVLAGRVNMGGVDKGNLTTTYYGVDPSGVNAVGGSQSNTLTLAQIPAHDHGGAATVGSLRVSALNTTSIVGSGIGGGGVGTTTPDVMIRGSQVNASITPTGTLNIASAGGGTPHSIVQPTTTTNYIVKVTPDVSASTATGVASIQGMIGVLTCGSGLTCTGNVLDVTPSLGVTSVFGRTGAVVATSGDYNFNQLSGTATLLQLAAQSANTVVGNATGSSASPTALAMPSCSTAASALIWTTSSGFGCNTIAGSGTVNSGTINQLAYYAATGTAVSGNANITVSSAAMRLGVAGSALGTLLLSGSTSGTVTLAPQATAGTPTITFGTSSGTPAVTATAPLTITAATGNIGITGAAGQIPNGTTGAFTATPTLGASGTLGSITMGNATSGTVTLQPTTGALGTVTNSLPAITATLTANIAAGTASLGTSAISSATCATVVTVAATGVATTDIVTASFNGDPTAVTGYVPLTTGMLAIIAYPTSGNVNFKVCNNTASSITPGAITLNWKVVR